MLISLTRVTRLLWPSAVVAVLAIAGCTSDRSASEQLSETPPEDSPIDRTAHASVEGELESLGEPSLEIAVRLDERPLRQVVGVAALSDGRIVVATNEDQRILYFDASGHLLSTVGGRGAAPDRFTRIGWIKKTTGDSLLVYDNARGSVSVYTPEGHFLRSVSFRSGRPEASAEPVGRFSDGTYLARLPNPERRRRITTGAFRDSSEYSRHSSAGSPVAAVGRFANDDGFVLAQPVDGHHLHQMFIEPPFGHRTLVSVDENRFYMVDESASAIRVYSPEGTLKQVFRSAIDLRPVTPEDIERFRTTQLTLAKSDKHRREIEERLSAVPYPQTMPAWHTLLTDEQGQLWAARYAASPAEPLDWMVFGRNGRVLRRVRTPGGLTIHEVGDDYIVGVRRHEASGVDRVELYSLRPADRTVAGATLQ